VELESQERHIDNSMVDLPSRRKHTRFVCAGGAEIRRSEGMPAVFASLTDISLEGCYVETVSTLPSGAEVLFMLRIREVDVRGRALIKTSNHAVGMGLEFTHLSSEDQQKLEFLVGNLSGIQDMRPAEKRATVPEEPMRIPAPLTTNRPVPTDSMTSPPHAAAAPAPGGHPMSQKLLRTVGELGELEQNLVKDRVDPRLIAQFHDAVEHLRQTGWTLQQWLDLNNSGGDPFEALPQLEAERMHMLGKLAHNVTADIDSSSLNEFTLGISELYETVQALYRRLHKMLVGDAGE
jgi:PilZ domain